jgi:hypothetical protein
MMHGQLFANYSYTENVCRQTVRYEAGNDLVEEFSTLFIGSENLSLILQRVMFNTYSHTVTQKVVGVYFVI